MAFLPDSYSLLASRLQARALCEGCLRYTRTNASYAIHWAVCECYLLLITVSSERAVCLIFILCESPRRQELLSILNLSLFASRQLELVKCDLNQGESEQLFHLFEAFFLVSHPRGPCLILPLRDGWDNWLLKPWLSLVATCCLFS